MGGSLAEEEIDSHPFAWIPIPSTDVSVERDGPLYVALLTFRNVWPCYLKMKLSQDPCAASEKKLDEEIKCKAIKEGLGCIERVLYITSRIGYAPSDDGAMALY